MARPFRFGVQISSLDPAALLGRAQRAEEAGFDVVLLADHVGDRGPSPMPALGAIAAATTRIRIGTLVLNADMRNPVQLAWEASTLDHLSGGRFELGLGAGHTPQEYAAVGQVMDPPRVRKERLAEYVELIRKFLDGDAVTSSGTHHRVEAARVARSVQERLPILVGGNGDALLAHAARHADVIGLQGLGRTGPDGHSHAVKWDPAWLDQQVEHVRRSAGDRIDDVELSALVQFVEVTDDAEAVLKELSDNRIDVPVEHLREVPYVLVGTHDEIADQLLAARERWGITYVQVRDIDAMQPVIERVRTLDAA